MSRSESPMLEKETKHKTQNTKHKTRGRHRHKQLAIVLACTLPTFSFVISMLMRFLSPSVQFDAFFFRFITISDSFSQLTQMASINFSIKIRIYKSEQFNKPPRDRQGATRISPCIVGFADSICSSSPSPWHHTLGCVWCEKQKICIKRCRQVFLFFLMDIISKCFL